MSTIRTATRAAALAAIAATAAFATACSSGGATAPAASASASASATEGNGPATLWVRAADAPLDKQLVEAWNAKNPDRAITLVAIPDAQYVQKFIQGVRSGDAPDIAVVDIANAQALVTQGLLTDITDKVNALDYAKQLAPGAIAIASADNKIYGVPHQLDVSLLYYNTKLFKEAGLDPASPPKNYDDIYNAAKKITALGDDKYGFYFAGNCAGCNAYGTLPWIWANGGDVLDPTGTKATLDDPAVATTFNLYQKMWDEKLIPNSAKDDNGATWVTSFQSGKIGMLATGSFAIGIYGAKGGPDFDVTPIVGQDGNTAAFLGGDVAGITTNAKNAGTAWDFLTWSMSPDVQTDIVAKAGSLVVRSDLINNPNTAADPRRAKANELIATAKAPNTPSYNAVFIDATGPFLQLIRNWIFDGQGTGAIQSTQSAFDERLAK